MSLRLSKLLLLLHLADLCLEVGVGGNEHPTVNLSQLPVSFHLHHKNRMFLQLLSSSLL